MKKNIILYVIPLVVFLIITTFWQIATALIGYLLQLPLWIALWVTFGIDIVVTLLVYSYIKAFVSKNTSITVSDLDSSMGLIVTFGIVTTFFSFSKGHINDGIVSLIFILIYGFGISGLKKKIK